MGQLQQDRVAMMEKLGKSLNTLRVEIGELLKSMIEDDDSQHDRLKQVRWSAITGFCIRGFPLFQGLLFGILLSFTSVVLSCRCWRRCFC